MKSVSVYKFSIPYLVALLLHMFYSSKSILVNSIISIIIIGLLLLSAQTYYQNRDEMKPKKVFFPCFIFSFFIIFITAIEILHDLYVTVIALN